VRLLLDENTSSRSFLAQLRRAGHDVDTTLERLGPGTSDTTIAALAVSDRRVLVTRDCQDFLALYAQFAEHPGLLLIYGFVGKATRASALVAAIANVAKTYPLPDNLVLALNDFFW
jgi:predicted nuclease of predicted toxin-antitoxin system